MSPTCTTQTRPAGWAAFVYVTYFLIPFPSNPRPTFPQPLGTFNSTPTPRFPTIQSPPPTFTINMGSIFLTHLESAWHVDQATVEDGRARERTKLTRELATNISKSISARETTIRLISPLRRNKSLWISWRWRTRRRVRGRDLRSVQRTTRQSGCTRECLY